MKYDTPFASRFRALRESIPATQAEMAERLGITQQSISFYEKGDRLPDFYVLDRICQLTGCSIKYLFGYQSAMSDALGENEIGFGSVTAAKEKIIMQTIMLNDSRAEVLSMLMRPKSVFWDILRQLQIIAGGDQARYFENPVFTSGYYEFLCHSKLDEMIEAIRQEGYDTLTDIERQEIEIRRQNLEKAATEFINEQINKEVDASKHIDKMKDAFVNRMKENAKGDKFKEFKCMLMLQGVDDATN